jgi:hypothetical protein
MIVTTSTLLLLDHSRKHTIMTVHKHALIQHYIQIVIFFLAHDSPINTWINTSVLPIAAVDMQSPPPHYYF